MLPDGPPPRHTGGFGEPTCAACHDGGPPPGTPAATAEIVAPADFEPGRTYDVTVAVRRPGLARAGFQVAVRYAPHEPLAALQAGSLVPADTVRTGVVRDSATGVRYARHKRAGTLTAAGEGRWTLRWTAPAARQAVVFHAAFVAANDDNSNLDDEVLARAVVVRPARR